MEKVVVALCGCEGVGLCVAERSVRWWESKPYFGEEGVSACWAGIWRDIWKEDIERAYIVAFDACEFEESGCALEGRAHDGCARVAG
jgi:hypothetical protein